MHREHAFVGLNALVCTSSPASGVAFCSAPPPSSIGLAAAFSHHLAATHQSIRHTRLRSTGCALLVYNYICNHGGLTLWCAQSVGVAASSSRQTASCSFQPPHLHVLTYSTISYTKPPNTQLLINTMYATCYGLRSPLADCDRSTRRAQAIGSLLGPAARLGSQRRINDPAEFPGACHAAWGSVVSRFRLLLSVCSLCASFCSVTG
jgi:hypothetical protein